MLGEIIKIKWQDKLLNVKLYERIKVIPRSKIIKRSLLRVTEETSGEAHTEF